MGETRTWEITTTHRVTVDMGSWALAYSLDASDRAAIGDHVAGWVDNAVREAVALRSDVDGKVTAEVVGGPSEVAHLATTSVSTDQLNPGDLILHYGMRIRLGERHQYAGNHGGDAWWFPGTVENMSEVYRPDHVTWGLLRKDGRWTVQGNALATWARVAE